MDYSLYNLAPSFSRISYSCHLKIRLHRQRAHVSLLADPPGSHGRSALLFFRSVIKTPPVEAEKCSRFGRFGVEGVGEVGAE
jgi:hypothetical protein